jgi:EmrB/QacA subfamily drug resistance transporter
VKKTKRSGEEDLSITNRRLVMITVGVMLSLFMGSMEATVVSTAMPTIVSQLGGLDSYSWVFTAYMLASTTTVPIYGKLSDLYGRRPVYGVAMTLFLLGSVLCGFATSMPSLIAYRAIQGLGAGGILPLAFIIVGDLYTFEQRARIQGLFSGVWGVSSVIGPLLGGFLVDTVGWPWVFFANIVPGVIAALFVWVGWTTGIQRMPEHAVRVDYGGAALLTVGVVALLLGLFELGTTLGWACLGIAAATFVALGVVEGRASDPILPFRLFGRRLFAIANLHGVLAGAAVFGSASFVPLFGQAVLGMSATAAGAMLTPQLIAWVVASIVGSRLLLRVGFRSMALVGMTSVTVGSLMMTEIGPDTSLLALTVYLAMMGLGMGLSIPSFLLAVQNTVRRSELGTATSTVQFSRSIGGAVGVSIMGALLSAQLAAGLVATGLNPAAVDLNALLDPLANGAANPAIDGAVQTVLSGAIARVFMVAFVASAIGLAATFLTPRGRIDQLERPEEPESTTQAQPARAAFD